MYIRAVMLHSLSLSHCLTHLSLSIPPSPHHKGFWRNLCRSPCLSPRPLLPCPPACPSLAPSSLFWLPPWVVVRLGHARWTACCVHCLSDVRTLVRLPRPTAALIGYSLGPAVPFVYSSPPLYTFSRVIVYITSSQCHTKASWDSHSRCPYLFQ